MSETSLPKPTNWLVSAINAVLDALILGLGETAAISAAVSAVPFLGLPVINWIFRQMVGALASSFDSKAKQFLDILVIRFQNDSRKSSFDSDLNKFKDVINNPEATDADRAKAVQDAKDSADRLINRNR